MDTNHQFSHGHEYKPITNLSSELQKSCHKAPMSTGGQEDQKG